MKKRILVLSSTFPRWKNDHEPPFVFELSKRYTESYDVFALTPHATGSKNHEILDKVTVHRFRYAPAFLENLAYEGGISVKLKQYPLRYLLVIPFLLSELFHTVRIIKKEKIDLIHAHWIIPQGLIAIIATSLTKRHPNVLITAHGADVYTYKSGLLSSLKKYILNRCSSLTVVSQSMADSIKSLNISCKIDVIPMGTDLNKTFIPNKKKQQATQLVFVGRLVEKKGVRYLLDAVKQLVPHHPSINLLIIGQGPEKESLQNHAQHLGISKYLTFMGGLPQAQLPHFLQQSAIAVFPFIQAENGDQEGFGLVMVEAMGCGCATITTALPAIEDIIKNRKTGLIVKQKSATAIQSAVSELVENSELKEQIVINGRQHVMQNFDWARISNTYLGLIKSILDTPVNVSKL